MFSRYNFWCRASLQIALSIGLELRDAPAAEKSLTQLRALYEPFVVALSGHFLFAVPPFLTEKPTVDNWQTSPWMPRSPGLGGLPAARSADDHFD